MKGHPTVNGSVTITLGRYKSGFATCGFVPLHLFMDEDGNMPTALMREWADNLAFPTTMEFNHAK